jgi:Mrp family chromosome partitioning ATPase
MEKNIANLHKLGARPLPTNFGPLKGANANARIKGPCGDTMEMWLGIGQDKVVQATFATDGCHSSIVAGCLAAWLAEGRSLDEAQELSQVDVLRAVGEGAEEHCALLAVNTLRAALDDYLRQTSAAALSQCRHDSSAHGGPPPSSPEAPAVKPPADPHDEPALKARLQSIRHKVIVLSGKGGVGKSTVAANLALSLAMSGCTVGLLDVDIHGPSIPKLMGLEGQRPILDGETIQPIRISPNLKVMSIGFLLGGKMDAVIWRGPMKFGVIQQFLRDVAWGDLDFLIIDSPPGTGDEPLTVAQLIGPPASAVIVTTPQDVAVTDVRRSMTFCQRLSLHVLGIVENMSGFVCPHCGKQTDLFKTGGGEALAHEMGVPFLGRIPLDPQVVVSGDGGTPFVHRYAESRSALAFVEITRPILAMTVPLGPHPQQTRTGAATC